MGGRWRLESYGTSFTLIIIMRSVHFFFIFFRREGFFCRLVQAERFYCCASSLQRLSIAKVLWCAWYGERGGADLINAEYHILSVS